MTSSPEGLVPARHLRTVRTARSVVLVNYIDGTVTLMTMVLAVQHLGHRSRRFHRLVRLCRLGTRLPPASSQQTHDAIRAVRWAARLIPVRVACLEESVAAVLLLAAAGCRARWRHGIATDHPPARLDR